MAEPLLEFRGTTVHFGPVAAVRGVDLTVRAGETLGVAGESGSGKSTLALSVLRLLPRTATVGGQVLLGGADVAGLSWGQLRAVRWAGTAIVFQGAMHALNPVRRIADQIAEPILLHGSDRDVDGRVHRLLDQVGVPARAARAYPHELSGGQRQRVMIAMALACDPDLVIADEPTTALDVMVQAQVLDLLAALVADRAAGLLLISHDLSVLAGTCQRLAVMYAGRIVEHGPARDVVDHPTHPYTQALAAAHPKIGDPASRLAPHGLPGDPPDPTDLLGLRCPFQPRCAAARPDCATADVTLRPAGEHRQAACVLVDRSLGAHR
ncbi:MAG TPA: ABC transporter ATP-binding protein [Pseudonocardiaceae bacterium]